MAKILNPRAQIQKYLQQGNLKALLKKSAEIHGHYCTYLALGVKATYLAFKNLGIVENPGMEEVMVLVECNNCFTDGIQGISGCTFGNNAMVYKDLGKTSASFWIRGNKKAFRVVVKPYDELQKGTPEEKELNELFEKAVKQRKKLSPKESERMAELAQKLSFQMLERDDEEVFKTHWVQAPKIEYAPIFESVICNKCKESVMESHIRLKQGKPYCLKCYASDYYMVLGKGICTGK